MRQISRCDVGEKQAGQKTRQLVWSALYMLKPTSSDFALGDGPNRPLLLKLSDQPAQPDVRCVRYPTYGELECCLSTYLNDASSQRKDSEG